MEPLALGARRLDAGRGSARHDQKDGCDPHQPRAQWLQAVHEFPLPCCPTDGTPFTRAEFVGKIALLDRRKPGEPMYLPAMPSSSRRAADRRDVLICLLGMLALGLAATSQALSGLPSQPSDGQEWRQFRGRGGRGIADDSALPSNWSTTDNVVWNAPVPGMGWSSPIVTGELIVVTSVISSAPGEEPTPGLYFRRRATDPHGPPSLGGVRLRRRDR